MNDEKETNKEKEKTTKKERWFIAAAIILLFIGAFYLISGLKEAQDKRIEESRIKPLDVINLEKVVLTESINEKVDVKDLAFTTNKDGTIIARTKNSLNDIYIGSAITGKVNGIDYLVSSESYNWTWIKEDYNITRRRVNITRLNEAEAIRPVENITEDLIDNLTFTITNLTAVNNKPDLIWKQQWIFDPERNPKLKYSITNNLGKDITNITFWFVFKLPENFKIKYDGTDYNVTKTGNTRVINTKGINLTSVVPIIDLKDIEFIYADLLKNNFTVNDFYVGNGSLIGHPETLIGAIGVTKGNSILKNGTTIILDPDVTDWKNPTRTGQFFNNWINGINLKVSDNVYATTTLSGKTQGTDLYGFDSIPANANVIGIEIQVEAYIWNTIYCEGGG